MWKRTRFLLLILSLISSFFFLSNFQILKKKSSFFSQGLRGTQSWNLVHTWTVGWCIMCTWIRLLVFIYSFISSIFFQIPKHLIFCPTFLWGLQSWNLIHMSKGLIYCVHQIQAARIYLFLYFSSFFCLSNWQRLKTSIYKIVSTYLWWLRPWVCELYSLSAIFIIAPLWKSEGYTGFALSFRHSVILSFRNLSN